MPVCDQVTDPIHNMFYTVLTILLQRCSKCYRFSCHSSFCRSRAYFLQGFPCMQRGARSEPIIAGAIGDTPEPPSSSLRIACLALHICCYLVFFSGPWPGLCLVMRLFKIPLGTRTQQKLQISWVYPRKWGC